MEVLNDSLIIVARIAKPHGIRGEVVLESWSDVKGRLEESDSFLLVRDGKIVRNLKVESRRFFNGRHVLKFEGISNLNESELLRGHVLAISEDQLGALPEDQYFIHQLVGMIVKLRDGREVGKVVNVMKTGGVDLLEVGEKRDILIPFTSDICVEVNPELKEILIDPPEGLLQLNAN
jgi:16S rRNA processing protein RimM